MVERKWFPRRVLDGLTAGALGTGLLIYFLLGDLAMPSLVRLLLAMAWPLALQAAALANAERGIRIDADGITVVRWHGPEQHHPWDTVRGVQRVGIDLQIDAGSQVIIVDTSRYPAWRRLQRTIEVRLAGDQGEAVGRDEISELLGCDPDRGLTCSAPIRWLRLAPLPLCWLLVDAGAWPVGLLLLVGLSAWATADRRRHWVRADGQGLEIRRGRNEQRVAWSEVDSIEVTAAPYARFYATPEAYSRDALVRLHTVHGTIEWLYSDHQGAVLADAIRRVLEARAAGRRLPDPGLVTNASISPARLGSAETERSISRVEG